jgi:hypothetical protein
MVEILCTHVCKGKMRPAETILGMEGGRIKENDVGVNSAMIYCRTFVKSQCTPTATIKKSNKDSLKEIELK